MAFDTPPITDNLIEDVARKTGRTKHSVYRRLLGLEVRGQAGTTIDAALAALGLSPPVSVKGASPSPAVSAKQAG